MYAISAAAITVNLILQPQSPGGDNLQICSNIYEACTQMLNNFQLNTSLVYQSALLRRILNVSASATVNASATASASASVFGSCRKKGSAGTAGVCLYSTSMLAMFSKLFSPGQMQFLIYYL